eukprot:2081792-Lingulodinium_polyedra.AAC.1
MRCMKHCGVATRIRTHCRADFAANCSEKYARTRTATPQRRTQRISDTPRARRYAAPHAWAVRNALLKPPHWSA